LSGLSRHDVREVRTGRQNTSRHATYSRHMQADICRHEHREARTGRQDTGRHDIQGNRHKQAGYKQS
jgi:hypothetical protein